jgi:hypothetical protein
MEKKYTPNVHIKVKQGAFFMVEKTVSKFVYGLNHMLTTQTQSNVTVMHSQKISKSLASSRQ